MHLTQQQPPSSAPSTLTVGYAVTINERQAKQPDYAADTKQAIHLPK